MAATAASGKEPSTPSRRGGASEGVRGSVPRTTRDSIRGTIWRRQPRAERSQAPLLGGVERARGSGGSVPRTTRDSIRGTIWRRQPRAERSQAPLLGGVERARGSGGSVPRTTRDSIRGTIWRRQPRAERSQAPLLGGGEGARGSGGSVPRTTRDSIRGTIFPRTNYESRTAEAVFRECASGSDRRDCRISRRVDWPRAVAAVPGHRVFVSDRRKHPRH